MTGRRVPGTVPVGVAAALISLIASSYFVSTGVNLAYGDARAHLTIARRLFDTLSNPGLGQLGTVWLPIPHLLLAPFVVSLWAWQTGWGAAALGAACLGATAASVYRICARWGMGGIARLAAAGLVVGNPTMLYLSSTALTEPVLIASVTMAFAGLANWVTKRRRLSPGELAVFAGIPTALAVLSRYEGWALVALGSLLVCVVDLVRRRTLAATAKDVIGFAAVPMVAIGWWIAFNWVTFHDPFAFLFGEYSAEALQAELVAKGLTTKGNLLGSLATMNTAVLGTAGPLLVLLAAAGTLIALANRRSWPRLLFFAGTTFTYLFMVLSLYLGQAVVFNQTSSVDSLWNNRYGMSAIIPLTLLIAAGIDTLCALLGRLGTWPRRIGRSVIAVATASAIIAGAVWTMQAPTERSLVLEEASVQASVTGPRDAARWLGTHYDSGMILMDETVSQNSVLPLAGIPLNQYYLRSTGTLFTTALARPSAYARWVWTSAGDAAASDLVTKAITADAHFTKLYTLVYQNANVIIYRRNWT